jgi:hypothetical protein
MNKLKRRLKYSLSPNEEILDLFIYKFEFFILYFDNLNHNSGQLGQFYKSTTVIYSSTYIFKG